MVSSYTGKCWQRLEQRVCTGRGTITAPAALQQMRFSVLQCLGQLADLRAGPNIWKGMIDQVAEAVAGMVDSVQTSPVREAAAQVLSTPHCSTVPAGGWSRRQFHIAAEQHCICAVKRMHNW